MQESKNSPKETLAIFSLASFLHDVGSDMVFSVWPIFVTSVLGANMTVLGLIDGAGDAVVSLSQAISGYLSDRFRKRKFFVWLGYLFGGIARLGYAIAPSWQFLIPFRLLDRSGKIRSAPRDAIISDISTQKNRGRHFGILQAMDNAGAVVGILLAIFLLSKLGYRNLFFLAAIPSFIAVILLIVFVKETRTPAPIYKGITLAAIDPNLRLYTILSAFFSLGSFSYSFLLIFAQRQGIPIVVIPIFYLLFTIIAASFSIYFGTLADKVGRKRVLYLSFLFWAGVSVAFIFFRSTISIIIAFVLYGLHKAAIEPVQKTFVAEFAPKGYVASSIGGFQMIVGLCALPASLIAGMLWDKINSAAPFYFSLILTIVAVVLLFFVKEHEPKI